MKFYNVDISFISCQLFCSLVVINLSPQKQLIGSCVYFICNVHVLIIRYFGKTGYSPIVFFLSCLITTWRKLCFCEAKLCIQCWRRPVTLERKHFVGNCLINIYSSIFVHMLHLFKVFTSLTILVFFDSYMTIAIIRVRTLS